MGLRENIGYLYLLNSSVCSPSENDNVVVKGESFCLQKVALVFLFVKSVSKNVSECWL